MTIRGRGCATVAVGVKRNGYREYISNTFLIPKYHSMAALQPVGGPIPLVPVPVGPAFVPMDGEEAVTHMLTVCGLTLAQRNAVTNVEGIQDIAALAAIYLGDVKRMTKNLSRLTLSRGGAYIGTSATGKFKALIWWVQDDHAQGNVVDPNDWNAEILDDARKRMLLEKLGRDKVDDIVEAPKEARSIQVGGLVPCLHQFPSRTDRR
jgi:hypothetical protein